MPHPLPPQPFTNHVGEKMPKISEMILTARAEDLDDEDEEIDDDSDDWEDEE